VINILLKALTTSPLPDFSLCLSLLGEAPLAFLPSSSSSSTPQDPAPAEAAASKSTPTSTSEEIPSAGNLVDPLIVKLSTLNSLLFEARFRSFWKLLRDDKEYAEVREFTKNVNGFENMVRENVMRNVCGTFRSIGLERLGEYLSLSGEYREVCLIEEQEIRWKRLKIGF